MPIRLLVFMYADKLYVAEITESGVAEAVSFDGKQALPLPKAGGVGADFDNTNLPQVVTESAQTFLQAVCENYGLTSLQDEMLDIIFIDCGADKRQVATIQYACVEAKSCCSLSIEHALPQVVWQRNPLEAGAELVVGFAGKYYRLSYERDGVLRYKGRGRKDRVELELTAEDFACLFEYRPQQGSKGGNSEQLLALQRELQEAKTERDKAQAELNDLRPNPNSLLAKKVEVIKKYVNKVQNGANFYAKGNIPKGKLKEALGQFNEYDFTDYDVHIDKDKVIGLFDYYPSCSYKGCTNLIVFTEDALFKYGTRDGYVKIRYDDISTMKRCYDNQNIIMQCTTGMQYFFGLYSGYSCSGGVISSCYWGMSEDDLISLLNELRALSDRE